MELKIHTNRLIIRNLLISDLDSFYSYRSNPEVTKYQGFDVFSREQCLDFIESQTNREFGIPGEWVQYGIERVESGKIVGDCAIKLEKEDPRTAQIGITISHLEQRKGYASETLKGILGFLFDNVQIRRVIEIVDTENVASIGLLKSTGFRPEGHFIENIFFKGKWGSEYQYAMLKQEWNNLKMKQN